MTRLEILLLGPFKASLNGEAITTFESSKVRALLAYLAAEAPRLQPRERLAGLLWPDWPQRSAVSNLRYALADLRKNLRDRESQPAFLLISRESIGLNPDSDVWIDIAEFDHSSITNQKSTISNQKSPISLYSGEFLEGFSLNDSPDFEAWVLAKREYFKRQMLKCLRGLSDEARQRGAY